MGWTAAYFGRTICRMASWILKIVALLALLACSSTPSSPALTSSAVCAPGATQLCAGSAACVGAQRCAADGLSWGSCDCGGTGGTGGSGGAVAGAGGTATTSSSTAGAGGSTGGAGGSGGVVPPECEGKPVHAPCSDGGVECDGLGNCVACAPYTCAAPPAPYAIGQTCGTIPNGCGGTLDCDNNQHDGTETDFDCGGCGAGPLGSCQVKCAQGRRCFSDPDCESGTCYMNVNPHVCT